MQLSKRLPYLLVAACSILYFLPFLRLLSHQGDEGTLIDGAVRVTEGQLPFRDFFEVMGPGTFYWLALFFKLLGTTWLATRICLLFTTLGITLLLFYLARRLRCGMEAVPVIFFVAVSFHNWNAISHHMDSTLFGLASFAALACWMDQPRGVMLFLAGAGAGLTTWCMLPKGVLLCLSFLLLVWILYRGEFRFRSMLTLLGGYLLAIASGLALFWRAGGLPDLIYANVLWPLTNYSGINVVPYGLEFRKLYWDSFTGCNGDQYFSFQSVSDRHGTSAGPAHIGAPLQTNLTRPRGPAVLVCRFRILVLRDAPEGPSTHRLWIARPDHTGLLPLSPNAWQVADQGIPINRYFGACSGDVKSARGAVCIGEMRHTARLGVCVQRGWCARFSDGAREAR
jgi:hypothetical protein